MTPIIDIRAVSVEISGRKLVDQVTMPIEQGQVLALVGPNGAGKSTLMKVISGDLPPDAWRCADRRQIDRRLSTARAGAPPGGAAAANIPAIFIYLAGSDRDGTLGPPGTRRAGPG